MLKRLKIENLAVFENVEIVFDNGFTVLWGDTGVGKSCFLDALTIVSGGAVDKSLIRPGTDSIRVEAHFSKNAGSSELDKILNDADIPISDNEIILRREVGIKRSVAQINDKSVTQKTLSSVGKYLIEVQSQFASLKLMHSENHLIALDLFGDYEVDLANFDQIWQEWKGIQAKKKDLTENSERLESAKELLSMEVAHLNELDIEKLNWTETEDAFKRNEVLEKITEAITNLSNELVESDISSKLSSARRILSQRQSILDQGSQNKSLPERLKDSLDASYNSFEDALAVLEQLGQEVGNASKEDINREIDRYFTLKETARRFKVSADALPELLKEKKEKLQMLANSQNSLAEINKELSLKHEKMMSLANKISEKRSYFAKKLASAVAEELKQLNLEKSIFTVDIKRLPNEETKRKGIDEVTFLFSANPGIAAGPLQQQASGGEMSRLMLALQLVIKDKDHMASIAFDEVEAGLGGQTSYTVGDRLRKLSNFRQILVVTHSPQVAAHGDHHILISKHQSGNNTVSKAEVMNGQEIIDQLARSLSGKSYDEPLESAPAINSDNITFEAKTQAERLIRKALKQDQGVLLLDNSK